MKKFVLIFTLTGYILAGCNKSLLDTKPTDRYYESDYWTTPEAVTAGLTACYSSLRGGGTYGSTAVPLWEEGASSNVYCYSNDLGFNSIAKGQQSPTTGGIISSRWASCYGGIGRCNTYLVKSELVDMGTLKNRMKGEAYFLRALYYNMLQVHYGDVPLILDPPDPATQSDISRTPRAQVVEQILKDLDSAAALLPNKNATADKGRATKGAALGLKARVLLFEASPLFNTGNDNNKWKIAADAAKAVMNMATASGYALDTDYRLMFLPADENNSEVLFDVQYMYPDQGNSFDLICRQYNSNAPLLDLVNAYQMKNGLSIKDPASGYDPTKPYNNRDPRLYATIVYPGDTYMNVKVTDSRFALTGYGMKKYSIYDKGVPAAGTSDLKDGQSETNFIILRYADILLMYAEAQNEFAGPDATVYDNINKIRKRAGMPDIAAIYTKDQLRDIIRQERRVEFAGEALYYNDLRRWKTAEVALNATIYNFKGAAIETRKFNPARDYWWPVPQTQRDLNPNLSQNLNY
ncbi:MULTISPECIES: RagB/SusD family nutrient uptake outer membrane protein [Niastella]|uniref:RagB/SusD family nutrient uptake outer membrane protein n=1 Tax=Niastella soli TaxID=2821487 RepID=A0ABS3Z3P0_9BACT|nr:RagB/SusD family nutrient uptake outer membrane protein [Niastella soli]MBO9204786.1 RagB/SusD family nutrient uptake outer membrane protein [Niastella soli]